MYRDGGNTVAIIPNKREIPVACEVACVIVGKVSTVYAVSRVRVVVPVVVVGVCSLVGLVRDVADGVIGVGMVIEFYAFIRGRGRGEAIEIIVGKGSQFAGIGVGVVVYLGNVADRVVGVGYVLGRMIIRGNGVPQAHVVYMHICNILPKVQGKAGISIGIHGGFGSVN